MTTSWRTLRTSKLYLQRQLGSSKDNLKQNARREGMYYFAELFIYFLRELLKIIWDWFMSMVD
jgi:hypothetical protein